MTPVSSGSWFTDSVHECDRLIDTSDWYSLILTYDARTGELVTYLQGTELCRGVTHQALSMHPRGAFLGAGPSLEYDTLHGRIDEVGIWSVENTSAGRG